MPSFLSPWTGNLELFALSCYFNIVLCEFHDETCVESFQYVYATAPVYDVLTRGPLFSSEGVSCFVSGYEADRSSYYSPGYYCPSGYTTAHSLSSIVEDNIEETTIVCCPSVSGERYFYDTGRKPFGYEIPFICKWEFGSRITTPVTWISAGVEVSTTTTTVGPIGAINAHGYQIRFRAGESLTPSSASLPPGSESSLSPTTRPPIQAPPTQTPPLQTAPPDNESSSGLSTAGAAGIGVSATIVVIGLIFAAFYFGRRSSQLRKQAEVRGAINLPEMNPGGTSYYNGHGQEQQKYYYAGGPVPVEMGATLMVGELPLSEVSTLPGNAQGRNTSRSPATYTAPDTVPFELDSAR